MKLKNKIILLIILLLLISFYFIINIKTDYFDDQYLITQQASVITRGISDQKARAEAIYNYVFLHGFGECSDRSFQFERLIKTLGLKYRHVILICGQNENLCTHAVTQVFYENETVTYDVTYGKIFILNKEWLLNNGQGEQKYIKALDGLNYGGYFSLFQKLIFLRQGKFKEIQLE